MKKVWGFLSYLSMGIFLLTGCSGQQLPTVTNRPTPTPSPIQLRPDVQIPSTCPVAPVYQGQTEPSRPGLENVPWVRIPFAPVSDIVGYLLSTQFQGNTYQPLHIGSDKILWIASNATGGNLVIHARNLSTGQNISPQTFQNLDGYQMPSTIQFPISGCWQLTLASGTKTGTIVFWVLSNN